MGKTKNLIFCSLILSQWAWFGMSTRNFIGSGQNSTHPLLDDRWIARSAITRDSCVFNAREHRVSRDAPVRKQNWREWRTPRDYFGFLDWNIYFHKGCNYSNEAYEMM